MKRARITGTLRYDFQYFPVDLPDSVDIEDTASIIEYEIEEIEETP